MGKLKEHYQSLKEKSDLLDDEYDYDFLEAMEIKYRETQEELNSYLIFQKELKEL